MIKTNDFLEHYGVKGMKWGVRRSREQLARARKQRGSDRTSYQKSPSRLSDSELNRRIKRMEMEKKYNELNSPPVKAGKKYVNDLLQNAGKTAAGAVVGGAASFFVQKALKEKFNKG